MDRMKISQGLENQVKECKSLQDLNELSREIKDYFQNLNVLVKERRVKLTEKKPDPVDRKKILRELNNLNIRR